MKPHVLLQADLIAETCHLGRFQATYRGEWRLARKLTIGCFQIVALAMVALYPWALFSANPRAFGGIATVCFSVTSLFFLLLLVLFVGIWSRTISPRYVQLYAEGFISTQGRRIQAVRWDEVRSFYTGMGQRAFIENLWYLSRREIPFIPPTLFSLRTEQGTIFHFNRTFRNLAHMGPFTDIGERFYAETELENRMEREASIRLGEKAVAVYQAGLPVTFGKVQVSMQGVSIRSEVCLWNEIDSLALYDDEGVIREFKSSELPSDPHEETNTSLPASDLNAHLAYWHEEVSPGAWITLQVKDQHTQDWEWHVSEMPNALVFVALIAYALFMYESEEPFLEG